MPNNIKVEIDELLKKLPVQDRIDILESLGKKYRRRNSIKINAGQMGRHVDIRPDEINLKG